MKKDNKREKLHKMFKKILSVTLMVALIITIPGVTQIPGWIAEQAHAANYITPCNYSGTNKTSFSCQENVYAKINYDGRNGYSTKNLPSCDWAGIYDASRSSSWADNSYYWAFVSAYNNDGSKYISVNKGDGSVINLMGEALPHDGAGALAGNYRNFRGSKSYKIVLFNDYSSYEKVVESATITVSHNYSKSDKGGYYQYTCACGNSYTENKNFTFDVNHTLDGTGILDSKASSIGTFDVYIGGTSKGNDIGDYCASHSYDSSYEVKDIKPMTGYHNSGSSSYSGKIPAKAISVTIPWKRNVYTVKYNGNNNTGGSTASSSHQYGVAKNLTANGFTRTGYTFAGWATSATGAKAYNNQHSVTNLSTTNGATVNLYAVWTPISYNLTFEGNGGTLKNPGGNLYNKNPANTVPVTYNSSNYWAMTGDIPTRAGYTFAGWYDAATGGTQVYNASGNAVACKYWTASGSSYIWKHTGDLKVYAHWTPNPIKTEIQHWVGGFTNGEGNNGTAKTAFGLGSSYKTVNCGDDITFSTADAKSIPKGYQVTFLRTNNFSSKWDDYPLPYTRKQLAANYYVEYWYMPIVYNILYNMDGGVNPSTNPTTYKAPYGFTLANPENKTGYTFDGWYLDNKKVTGVNESSLSFTNADELYAGLNNRTIGDLTITAKWNPNSYTVRYDSNGGAGTMPNSTHTYDVEKSLSANSFEKEGWEFAGWNTKVDGRGDTYTNEQAVTNLTSENGGTVTLYAQWIPAKCQIAVKTNVVFNGLGYAEGNPVFIYCLTDKYDKNKKYYKAVEFTEEDDLVSQTVLFDNLPMSDYTLTEIETYRYRYEFESAVNGTKTESVIDFDMMAEGNTEGKATFTNIGIKFKWFGHNDIIGASEPVQEAI